MNEDASKKLLELRKKELELLKIREKLEIDLPHLYMPVYKWQRDFIDSSNRINLLTAANQCGKSTALIRRAISNCTEPKRWDTYFGGSKPNQIWYFYPDSNTLNKEFYSKWEKEYLPKDQKHQQYGWKVYSRNGAPFSLEFKAGPIIYFQSYSKKVANVQASTVSEIYADEELPMEFYDELMMRLFATEGYFNSGFTPTLNQLFWKQAMEGNKNLPTAFKQTISMYDCLKYEDGSPSRVMTLDKIHRAESLCKNETEKMRRIFGKFVTEEGRQYYAFDYDAHVKPKCKTDGWVIYAAVDYGSGKDSDSPGKKNHPAAIIFVVVNPNFKEARVLKSWRGDHEKTTAGDVFNKYMELKEGLNISQACYDPAAADFGTIAQRNGVSFLKADKSREAGVDLVNSLFKHNILTINDDDQENLKLASELMTIMIKNQRSDHKSDDDLADALRYCAMMIPWDLSVIQSKGDNVEKVVKKMTEEDFQILQIKMRRGEDVRTDEEKGIDGWGELEDEFTYWNEQFS